VAALDGSSPHEWKGNDINTTLRELCDALTAAAALLDADGAVVYSNPVFEAFNDGEACPDDKPWVDWMVVEEEQALARHAFVDVVTGRVDVEQVAARIHTFDGDMVWTLVAVGHAKASRKVLVLGQASSKTSFEQRQLQDLRYALDQSAIVAITNQKGTIQYVNDRFCEISKYAREELLGQDHRLLNSGYHTKDTIRDLWRTIARGNTWRGEFRNRAKDGSLYWVDTTIVPFLNDKGKPYQYLAIRYDITERKSVEQQLMQQRTLARLGEMAAVIAHEVKNPLAGIYGALQIIGGRMDESTVEHKILQDAQERLHDLSTSLEELLDFARPRQLHMDEIDVAELVYDTTRLVKAMPEFVEAGVEVSCSACDATGDAQALRETFLNLALNGLQATAGKGHLSIMLQEHSTSYTLEFRDNGPGIPAEKRTRVFEPFFSTKIRGTGLGLATVRRTIERHGGTVELECPETGGTIFRLVLPLNPRHT